MIPPHRLARYWHTLRHLRPVQFYRRLWFLLARPRPDLRPPPPRRAGASGWALPARRAASLLGPGRFCLLNETGELDDCGWDNPQMDMLWRYNQHYFDDLNAQDATDRKDWHSALMSRWVLENPPARGTGWAPYPTSLRIVNWLKWALAGHALPPECLESLGVQARWLGKRLEYHLLGNHLFANAKALVFAGLFFDGEEAAGWLETGMAILAKEIPEQILPDGGQFERSPMYHALALEDLLDLANLAGAYSDAIPDRWRGLAATWPKTIARMRVWLAGLCHPDGEIAFFNDASLGIAPAPAELDAYAERLGLGQLSALTEGIAHFSDSGYVRVQRGAMLALLDVAPVGPDYLPGHAHADTLSFELSLHGQRVLVNSGTSRYGEGLERLSQRGTAAHNTVTLDGQDSSEVWGGFRVARRAKPFGLVIKEDGDGLRVACAHDGYTRLPGKPVHRREWRFTGGGLEIVDTIEGGFAEAVGRLYFHPGLAVESSGASGLARLACGRTLRWRVEDAACRLTATVYHSHFGAAQPNRCLEMHFSGPRCLIRLNWD